MKVSCRIGTAVAVALFCSSAATAQWVEYENETSVRMPDGGSSVGTGDVEEKDFDFGDVDNDGDLDLISVRKQPFTSSGKKTNVLWMNEGGVLINRTTQYASDSDVGGDNGFDTPTNDRDVELVDVNNDGWLDIVTATTLTDNQAKHLSHPRIYINKGNDGGGAWLGFKFENARIPQMHATAGPRFCSIAFGDVDNDGDMDLYFGDYDSGPSQIYDYNNKLLINQGGDQGGTIGFFADETDAHLTSDMRESAFGASSEIEDMDGDGALDIVKQTALNAPQHVAITYNDQSNPGDFEAYNVQNTQAPYHVSVGDLNNDGKLDYVVSDDGADRFFLNPGGRPGNFGSGSTFSFQSGSDDGFGSDNYIEDLNNDGWNDVLICDVDVDISGCGRRMHIYRNLGNAPNVTLQEANPSIIPTGMLQGTHDVAIFDINGDGWKDLVIGRCSGTQVWMNQPPIDAVFGYPNGIPGFLDPSTTFELDVQIDIAGGAAGGAISNVELNLSINGGGFNASSMADLGGGLYRSTLPAGVCTDTYNYFISADISGFGTVTDPSSGSHSTVVALGEDITLRDQIEEDISGWTIISDPSLNTGEWEQADPNGTISGGELASPEDDATNGSENVMCFTTENGPEGGTAGANDVDGGPTRLISPAVDVAGTDATISYATWFFCSEEGVPGSEDFLVVEVSGNGATWVEVEQIAGTDSAWEVHSFVVSDFITPTSTVQVRFSASDQTAAPASSVTEAGIDNFQVSTVICDDEPTCPADFDGNGAVDAADLATLLGQWGGKGSADLSGNGSVGAEDLAILLGAWGGCP